MILRTGLEWNPYWSGFKMGASILLLLTIWENNHFTENKVTTQNHDFTMLFLICFDCLSFLRIIGQPDLLDFRPKKSKEMQTKMKKKRKCKGTQKNAKTNKWKVVTLFSLRGMLLTNRIEADT